MFEKDIAKDFFQALDWHRFNKGLVEQYQIKFATVTHRADFALFVADMKDPEIMVELKRPQKKKEEKDAMQLIDYMRQKSCSFGILLLGSSLEVYYIDYNTPQREATLVEAIKYHPDSEAAHQLMEVLRRGNYTSEKMLEYCRTRVAINKSIEHWCSSDGKAEIMNMIIEQSDLPAQLLETLRSTLHVEVRRNDGHNPIVPTKEEKPKEVMPSRVQSKPVDKSSGQSVVWLLPANSRFFDHKACFDELGYIYWKQYNNYHVGDTGYIYFTKPQMRIVYKFEVVACNLPYSDEMEIEKRFYKDPLDFEKAKQHNRHMKIKMTGECVTDNLSFKNLQKHGLKGGPQGSIKLSEGNYDDLLNYIESNF